MENSWLFFKMEVFNQFAVGSHRLSPDTCTARFKISNLDFRHQLLK